ncbi:MAG: hypothetical protein DDT20_00607 [Firmicutes bacterium]|nr:hypothetical protein [Bacillota bacterium]
MEDENCIVCGESCLQGQGLAVRQKFICKKCEQRIVLADVADAGYEHLKFTLRKLWTGVPLRER